MTVTEGVQLAECVADLVRASLLSFDEGTRALRQIPWLCIEDKNVAAPKPEEGAAAACNSVSGAIALLRECLPKLSEEPYTSAGPGCRCRCLRCRISDFIIDAQRHA